MNFRLITCLISIVITYGCSTIVQSQPRGFGGYAFHSNYHAIKEDMESTGYRLAESDETGLWYAGTLYGYSVDFSYEFSHGDLIGGYFDVLERSEASWQSVNLYLSGAYPLATTERCRKSNKLCRIRCTSDAKIVHLLTDDLEAHVVRYYERTPHDRCGSDQMLGRSPAVEFTQ